MAEKQVLQEFLAVLGFQVSQPTLKGFLSALKTSCIAAGKLSATIAGVAVAAETMVTVFARNMEKLFYLSQRTGATVAGLKELSFGFGQVGLSGEDALETIDEFAKRMRYEPGKVALFQNLVGGTTEKDPIKQLKMLMLKLREMTKAGAGFVAVQWAEAFGISEKVFNRLMQPGAIEAIGKAERKASGVFKALGIDQDQAARASRDFMNELRELWMIIETLGSKISIALLPYVKAFNRALLDFAQDVMKNGLDAALDRLLTKFGSWGDALKRVKDFAVPILKQFGIALSEFADDFAKFGLNTAIDKSLAKMGTIGKVLGLFKDVIMLLPAIPDLVANLVRDLFGPEANSLTNPAALNKELNRESSPVSSAFQHPLSFQAGLFDSLRTMFGGAQSETFAPKPTLWSQLGQGVQYASAQPNVTQNNSIVIHSTDPRAAGQAAADAIHSKWSGVARLYSGKNP